MTPAQFTALSAAAAVDPLPAATHLFSGGSWTLGAPDFILSMADLRDARPLAPTVPNIVQAGALSTGGAAVVGVTLPAYLVSAALPAGSWQQMSGVLALESYNRANDGLISWASGVGILCYNGIVYVEMGGDRFFSPVLIANNTPIAIGWAFDVPLGKYRIATASGIQASTDAGSTTAAGANTQIQLGSLQGYAGQPGSYYAYAELWADQMLSDADLVAACVRAATHL